MALLDVKPVRWSLLALFFVAWHAVWWGWIRPEKLVVQAHVAAPMIRFQPQIQSRAVARYWSPIFVEGGFGKSFTRRESEVLPPLGIEKDLAVMLTRQSPAKPLVSSLPPARLNQLVTERVSEFFPEESGPEFLIPVSLEPIRWQLEPAAAGEQFTGFDSVALQAASTNGVPWRLSLEIETEADGYVERAIIQESSGQVAIDQEVLRQVYASRLTRRKPQQLRLTVRRRGVKQD